MKDSTLLLAGLGYLFLNRNDGRGPAPRARAARAAAPSWPRFLEAAGASPGIARGLERAATLRGLPASEANARQLLAYFRGAWKTAKTHLNTLPPPREEDQLYFSVLQITEPALLKGQGGTTDARHAHAELLHVYQDDERIGKILTAAAHVAWGAPLAVEGVQEGPTT